jgi:hypothetical protein
MNTARVAIVDPDGAELAPPLELPAEFVADQLSAIDAGDGFLVAAASPASGLVVVKVGPDGRSLARSQVAPAGARSPQLLLAGGQPRLVFLEAASATFQMVRLDATGALVPGSATPLSAAPAGYTVLSGPLLGWNDEVLALAQIDVAREAFGLALTRRRPPGQPPVPPIPIARGPGRVRTVQLVRRGDEAVAVWVAHEALPDLTRFDTARLGLARIAP